MSTIRGLRHKRSHAERRWRNHTADCTHCAEAKSAVTLCDRGRKCWFNLARIDIDIERAEASIRGLSYAAHVAHTAR